MNGAKLGIVTAIVTMLTVDACAHSKIQLDPPKDTNVCTHLTSIGCPQPPSCESIIANYQGKFADFNIPCLLNAANKYEANDCGTVNCP